MLDRKLEPYIRAYAHTVVRCGLNVITNRVVFIDADIDQPDFVRLLVKECYQQGARRVIVNWTYRPIQRMQYDRTDIKELTTVYSYQVARFKFQADELTPRIIVESEDPDYLKGLDPAKIAATQTMKSKVRKPFRKIMDKVESPWVICTCPSVKWAKAVFPNCSEEVAVRKLWKAILDCCRITYGDPVENWKNYNKHVKQKAKWLNDLDIDTLHYTSKNGTDLVVGMTKACHWCGGAHDSVGNPPFNPNMPAVETFTSPDKYRINGIVYSSKPLCHNGQLIDEFYFVIKKGKIIEVHAKKGEKLLKDLVYATDTSCYLGECALVPYDSPVSNTGLIFYKTVFDENAACHFALGYSLSTGYPYYRESPIRALDKLGLNQGSTHIDFMVGTKDLNITATTRKGKKVAIFRNGNWAE